MNPTSRTVKSIKNSSVALVMFAVDLVLQFYSRKIFLDYLGTEILGLNTTATNLLQFLNLAELGIGTAVGFSLYKPFYENDTQTINEIVSLQGKLYRRIAYAVIMGSAVLMCFFPWIFAKMQLPLWYAYASFGVLLFSALLSYFVNYKQILLSANQQEYKIQYSYKLSILVKILMQILALKYFDNAYIWWLVLEVTFAIIASIALSITVRRTYPFINNTTLSFKELNAKYPTIQTKIKQVFVHKISNFSIGQISPLFLYTFTSLTVVALYGNYTLIIFGLARLSMAVFNGIAAGVGNLVAEGDKEKVISVFDEYFSVRFYISAIMCFGTLTLAQPFVQLWLGKEYLLGSTSLYIFVAILYIYVSRSIVEAFLFAYGFVSDIWAPIVEVALNVIFSIILGYYWGLNGVLSGLLISMIIIYLLWKPFFLFRIKLKYGNSRYFVMFTKHLVLGVLCAFVCVHMLNNTPLNPYKGLENLLLYGICVVLLYSVVLGVLLYLSHSGFKRFFARVGLLIKS